jgi:hypothetical protein
MLPGDSLVDKIFNEGLKSCTAFIVVLSQNSVNSKWVREELNAGIVKRIAENTKLIPLRLDGCEVPTALMSTLWIDIPNVDDYEREFEQIVNAVYGQYSKPPLGSAPTYVRPDVLQLEGLTPIDSIIFEHACKIAIEQGHSTLIHGERVVSELASQGISEKQIMESQEVLEGRLYVEPYRVLGPLHVYDFRITSYGFDQFVRFAVPDYGRQCADIGRLWSEVRTSRTIQLFRNCSSRSES